MHGLRRSMGCESSVCRGIIPSVTVSQAAHSSRHSGSVGAGSGAYFEGGPRGKKNPGL